LAAIAALSIAVSVTATLVAALFAIPGAFWIVHGRSTGRVLLLGFFNVGLGFPPVAVGLLIAFFFWRSGPLGWFDLLYTPGTMILAQVIVIIPLVGSLAVIALRTVDATLPHQLAALGVPTATRRRLLLREAAPVLAACVVAGFGRAIAEVGAAQMTGGNIEGQTRVLTTATMLAVGKGEFGQAFAYVAVLLGIMAVIAGGTLVLQARWR